MYKNSQNNSKYSSSFCFGSKIETYDDMKNFHPHSENKPSGENISEFDPIFVNKTQTSNTTKYIIDSGCARHVSTKKKLYDFTPGNFGDITIKNEARN